MRNEIDYIAFVLAYDLMHEDFDNSDCPECDTVYEKCLEIAKDFYKSEFNNPDCDLYSCLQKYVDYLRERETEKEYTEWEEEMKDYYMLDDEDECEYDEDEEENENENPLGMLGGFGWGVVFSGNTPEERAQDIENFKTFLKETGLDKICSVGNA